MSREHIKSELQYLGFGILMIFIIIVPILLGVYNQNQNSVSFWGSYLGGILGAIAVFSTTYLMIRKQNDSLKEQLVEQNNISRKQFERDFFVSTNKEITNSLSKIRAKTDDYFLAIKRCTEYENVSQKYLDFLDLKSTIQGDINYHLDNVILLENTLNSNDEANKKIATLNTKYQEIFQLFFNIIEKKDFKNEELSQMNSYKEKLNKEVNSIRVKISDRVKEYANY